MTTKSIVKHRLGNKSGKKGVTDVCRGWQVQQIWLATNSRQVDQLDQYVSNCNPTSVIWVGGCGGGGREGPSPNPESN